MNTKAREISDEKPRMAPLPRFVLTTCVAFTVVMVIDLIVGSLFAPPALQATIRYCWSVLAACALAAGLQLVFFTDVVLKRATYAVRVGLFGGCLYGVMLAIAVLAQWFPLENLWAWGAFTLLYLVVLGITSLAFKVVERRRAREFDERLRAYRKRASSR